MSEPAYFELSRSAALAQYEEVAALADVVSYSLKTNIDVGRVLEEGTVCRFSVHSLPELRVIQDSSRCTFFAQAWDATEVRTLLDLGVRSFVVDNEGDLRVFLSVLDRPVELLLRMRLKEHTLQTGKHFVFGFYSDELNRLLEELHAHQFLSSLGVHFHRKTQNLSEWSLRSELEQSISADNLKRINVVNMGGGLPSVYKNHKAGTLPAIFSKIRETKEWLSSLGITTVIEPGRFVAAPAVKLVTMVKNVYRDTVILNASVYNAAMDTFVATIKLLVEGEVDNRSGAAYVIKGCTPDSLDIFRYRVFLPSVAVGDRIVFLNAGAYNFTTEFCLLPKLETKVVE